MMHDAPTRVEVDLCQLRQKQTNYTRPPTGASAREPASDEENTAERGLSRDGISVRFLHRSASHSPSLASRIRRIRLSCHHSDWPRTLFETIRKRTIFLLVGAGPRDATAPGSVAATLAATPQNEDRRNSALEKAHERSKTVSPQKTTDHTSVRAETRGGAEERLFNLSPVAAECLGTPGALARRPPPAALQSSPEDD